MSWKSTLAKGLLFCSATGLLGFFFSQAPPRTYALELARRGGVTCIFTTLFGIVVIVERVIVGRRQEKSSLEDAFKSERGDHVHEPWRVSRRGSLLTVGTDFHLHVKYGAGILAGFAIIAYATFPRPGDAARAIADGAWNLYFDLSLMAILAAGLVAILFASVTWAGVKGTTFAFKRGETWFAVVRRGSSWDPVTSPWGEPAFVTGGLDRLVVLVPVENLANSLMDERTFARWLVSAKGARGDQGMLAKLVKAAGAAFQSRGDESVKEGEAWICVLQSHEHEFVAEVRHRLMQFLS